MGDTIWVLRKSQVDRVDDFDHSIFCKHIDKLDKLAIELGVSKFSDFLDYSDLEFNFSEEALSKTSVEDNQKWFEPILAVNSLETIISWLKSNKIKAIKQQLELIVELEDSLTKLKSAKEEKDLFHFAVIM